MINHEFMIHKYLLRTNKTCSTFLTPVLWSQDLEMLRPEKSQRRRRSESKAGQP